MTADQPRLLFWEGSSKKDFKRFPVEVQRDMGVALFVVQLGATPRTDVELVERRLKTVLDRDVAGGKRDEI